MSVFKTPYQTTVGKNLVAHAVEKTLKEVVVINPEVIDSTHSAGHDIQMGYINGVYLAESNVPAFVHPYLIKTLDQREVLFMDYRPFVKINPIDQTKVIIRNNNEYNLAKARHFSTKHWLISDPVSMLSVSSVPASVFASWISEGISHRFALDPLDQLKLSIISAFYYQSLFYQEDEFDKDTRQKMASGCIRYCRGPANIVFEVTDQIGKLGSVTDFCDNVKTIINNPRLTQLNSGLLITILKSSWFGNNAAELLAVSLEYPPTWISLVYTSLTERSFKNANLSKIVERYGKNNADNEFTRSFVSLVNIS